MTATFELTGPDGDIYHIDAPDEGAALSAFGAFAGAGLPTAGATQDANANNANLQLAQYILAMPPVFVGEAGVDIVPPEAEAAIPETIYRGGGTNPSNLTPRPQDQGSLSFGDSLSNPILDGNGEPLPPGTQPVLPPDKPYIETDTSKLPPGSVVRDGYPYGNQPPGHMSVKDVLPQVVKRASVKGKFP